MLPILSSPHPLLVIMYPRHRDRLTRRRPQAHLQISLQPHNIPYPLRNNIRPDTVTQNMYDGFFIHTTMPAMADEDLEMPKKG